MTDPEEEELLARAQAGDAASYARLVRKHQQRIFACAVHMLASTAEADDAVQETFIRAWRSIAKFDRRSAMSTWLYRICVNVCLNAIRRRSRRRITEQGDPRLPAPGQSGNAPETPEEAAAHNELHAQLAHAVDALPPSLRATVVLVLIQGVSHEETARILGCPEGTIAWRIHEARRRIHAALKARADEPAAKKVAPPNARRTP